ncbi:hypothetical protein GOODEAATRI_014561 [Goodea atripinnis]|uniref:Uncharacterized protein n=1 Tax=Goodea atripinnis TaxID=208336 RepID=A0ABV0PYK4_9TELE
MFKSLLRPPLSSGNSEEGEKGPSHIVIVEIVFLPLPLLRPHFVITYIHQIFASERHISHHQYDKIKETPLKELHGNHSKNEHEE